MNFFFSPDGRFVALREDGRNGVSKLQVKKTSNGEILMDLDVCANHSIIDICFSPTGQEIAILENSQPVATLKQWRIGKTPPVLNQVEVGKMETCWYSADGLRLLLAGSIDGKTGFLVFDTQAFKLIGLLTPGSMFTDDDWFGCLNVSPSGNQVAIYGGYRKLYIYRRHFPESWWGPFTRVEFLIVVLIVGAFAGLLIRRAVRRCRRHDRPPVSSRCLLSDDS